MSSTKEYFLVINAGSSSLKYTLFTKDLEESFKGHVDGIGLPRCALHLKAKEGEWHEHFKAKDHLHAVLKALKSLKEHGALEDLDQIRMIGHRVVHGGERYTKPTIIDERVTRDIKELGALAPLHNPPALAGILALKKVLPDVAQVAVFDTAYHQTIPKYAFLYGLPMELYEEHGIRKYGFHGISHEYVAKKAAEKLAGKREHHEIITCHLGNGSSITAVKDGKSIDTSMGFTPLDGLIMGTRSGGLDPEIIVYLLKHEHYTLTKVQELLQKRSGLKGIAGDSDMRELRERSLRKDPEAILALDMLAYRIAKYIGSYAAALQGLDAIVFTGGIGENAHYLRKKACAYLCHLGVELDAHANRKNETFIQAKKSKVAVMVLKTNEEKAIAEHLLTQALNSNPAP